MSPGTGRGKGSGPRTRGGAYTLLLQRGPRAREDLEVGALQTRSWVLLLLQGPYPTSFLTTLSREQRAFSNTGITLSPTSCLTPAHQAGDLSSVDPGTPPKVPILGASPTYFTGPLAHLYH